MKGTASADVMNVRKMRVVLFIRQGCQLHPASGAQPTYFCQVGVLGHRSVVTAVSVPRSPDSSDAEQGPQLPRDATEGWW